MYFINKKIQCCFVRSKDNVGSDHLKVCPSKAVTAQPFLTLMSVHVSQSARTLLIKFSP